jgi:hypothetical protein
VTTLGGGGTGTGSGASPGDTESDAGSVSDTGSVIVKDVKAPAPVSTLTAGTATGGTITRSTRVAGLCELNSVDPQLESDWFSQTLAL